MIFEHLWRKKNLYFKDTFYFEIYLFPPENHLFSPIPRKKTLQIFFCSAQSYKIFNKTGWGRKLISRENIPLKFCYYLCDAISIWFCNLSICFALCVSLNCLSSSVRRSSVHSILLT